MTTNDASGHTLGCRIGHHQYRLVNDDNPENRSGMHKECTRCGKIKDVNDYRPSKGTYLGGLPG